MEILTLKNDNEGQIIKNEKTGYGKLWNSKFSYYGNFKNNKFEGYGILEYYKNDLFKEYKGEFKEGKKDGFGKEIYINGEYYIGNFKNDLKNGKGKIFNKFNNIKIESEWVNNVARDNKYIIEYYDNGNKKFEGEYNGLNRNGNGKEYDYKEKLIFEGIFEDDKRKSGKIYNNEMIVFNGEFINNDPIEGIFYYDNGIKISECKVLNIKSTISDDNIICDKYLVGNNILLFHDDGSLKFEGNLLKNRNFFNPRVKTDVIVIDNIEYKIRFGSGCYYEKGKLFPKYEFDFYENEKKKEIKEFNSQNILVNHSNYDENGKLILEKEYYHNGDIRIENSYIGGELKNQKIYWQDNKIKYIASYDNNELNLIEYNNIEEKIYEGKANNAFKYYGLGKLYSNNQLQYEGNFNNSQYQGRGILYENGIKIYEGDFENNLYWGNGISYYESTENLEYEGEWVNGCKHGQGTLYSDSGEIVYSGLFHNNEIQMN